MKQEFERQEHNEIDFVHTFALPQKPKSSFLTERLLHLSASLLLIAFSHAKKLLPCFCTAGVFVRLLRAINKLFLYQEVLKQNIGYYIRTSESPSDRQALLSPFRLFQRPFGYFPWSAHLQACPPQRYFRQGEDISCHSNAQPDAGREAR